MTAADGAALAVVAVILAVTVPFAGRYLARVFDGGPAPGDRVFGPIERAAYRVVGVDPRRGQGWRGYAVSVVLFGAVSVLGLYAVLRLQGSLPLNPTDAPGMSSRLAFNTAASFVTGTNWQAYSGEVAMSHGGQLAGLVVAQFTAPAVSLAVAMALVRSLRRRDPADHRAAALAASVGNFWADLIRGLVRVLIPLAVVGALLLVARGAIQNLDGFRTVVTASGTAQVVPGGPAAAMESIKLLGNNGGGLFATGSAHPFENPDGLTNALQLAFSLLLPLALVVAYGRLVGHRRHALTLLAVMALLCLAPIVVGAFSEANPDPAVVEAAGGIVEGDGAPDGNLEGKDLRLGAVQSTMLTVGTMGTTTGVAAGAIDSYRPAGVASALGPILIGEVSPGGVGSGLVGAIHFAVLAVFVGGLMVGRTPDLLGRSLGRREMTLTTLYLLTGPLLVLCGAAASVALSTATAAATHDGTPRGFTEILYAFGSVTNGNGSALGGLAADTPWYDTTLGLAMLGGRFLPLVVSLALAGAFARRSVRVRTEATLPVSGVTFGLVLAGVIVLVGGLTYLPALALGPLADGL